MVLSNHIVYTFLMDHGIALDMTEKAYPSEFKAWKENKDNAGFSEILAMYKFLNAERNKNFIITSTVIELVSALKIDKVNWQYLADVPEGKRTYILPNHQFIRMQKSENQIAFCYAQAKKHENGNEYLQYTTFFVDTITGQEHVKNKEHLLFEVDNLFLFKLLCFVHLSETIQEVIAPGKVHGTRKTGKTNNDLPFAVTIVNSKWNVTSIRTTGFKVAGHFRVQPYGPSRSNYRIILIDTFEKQGYKRTAAKDKI